MEDLTNKLFPWVEELFEGISESIEELFIKDGSEISFSEKTYDQFYCEQFYDEYYRFHKLFAIFIGKKTKKLDLQVISSPFYNRKPDFILEIKFNDSDFNKYLDGNTIYEDEYDFKGKFMSLTFCDMREIDFPASYYERLMKKPKKRD